ncbi:MAG TPA: hypothetical protein VFC41_06815, partial [Anaerovoracaceae bacterium]|nr:hypothetical protein [Anaerovoracaceae bacterium]
GKRKLPGRDSNDNEITKRMKSEKVRKKSTKYNCPEDCRNFVVKCSLSHILPKTENSLKVRQVINNIVDNISLMSIEASRLINLYLLYKMENKSREPMHEMNQTFFDRVFALVSKIYTTSKGEVVERKERKSNKDEVYDEDLKYVYKNIYLKQCRPPTLPFANRLNLTKFRQSARVVLETNCKNHIETNFYSRTRSWIKFKVENILSSHSVSVTKEQVWKLTTLVYECSHYEGDDHDKKWDKVVQLFKERDPNSKKWYHSRDTVNVLMPLVDELIELRELYEIPIPTTTNLKKFWFKWIPWMYIILKDFCKLHQQYLRPDERSFLKGRRLFTLLPEHNVRPLSIQLDTTSLKSMCPILKEVGFIDHHHAYDDDENHLLWSKVFDLSKFPKSGQSKFCHSLKTDGYSVSLYMEKSSDNDETKVKGRHKNKKKKTKEVIIGDHDSTSEENKRVKKYKIEPGRRIVGVDPGRRDLFFGIYSDEKGKDQKVKCSNAEYYAMAGFKRRIKLDKKYWNVSESTRQLKKFNKETQSSKVSTVTEYIQYLKYFLQHYQDILHHYCQTKYKRLRFETYGRQQKAIDHLCRRLTGGDPNTIIAYGDAGFSSTSKGNAPTPNKGFKNRIHMHCRNIVPIDEYLTSQVCSECHTRNLVTTIHKEESKENEHGKSIITRVKKKKKVKIKINEIEEDEKNEQEEKSEKCRTVRPHGLRLCQECRILWNRDHNAAKNIRDIFLFQQAKKGAVDTDRPPHLSRPKQGSESGKICE